MKKISILVLIFVMFLGTTNANASTRNKFIKRTAKYLCQEAKKILKDFKYNRDLLANVIYHENWYTDKEKKTARWTGAVVLNRVESPNFPNTIEGVLYQKHPIQYSTTSKFFTEEIPQECYDMATELLLHGAPEVPKNVVYQATFKQGSGEWKRLNGESFCYE